MRSAINTSFFVFAMKSGIARCRIPGQFSIEWRFHMVSGRKTLENAIFGQIESDVLFHVKQHYPACQVIEPETRAFVPLFLIR
ncbi:MAG: hypothetical protein QM270_11575 [Bacillota bacterium]|nr:hypothetical protein [Bacillota bacterium]